MIGPQESHGARDAEECEIVDEGGQQEGGDDDEIRHTDDAEQLPAPILVCRQAGNEFERKQDREDEVGRHRPPLVANERRQQEEGDREEVEQHQAIAETAGAQALAEIQLSQMRPYALSRHFHFMWPARECRCASAPA
jgi:hypothetical protein